MRLLRRAFSSANYSATVHLPKTSFPAFLKEAQRRRIEAQLAASAAETYARQLEAPGRRALPLFEILDGPPYANGRLHVGHALNKLFKDFVIRYKAATGHRVRFRPGWDTHGLPIELKAAVRAGAGPSDVRAAARRLALDTIDAQREEFRSWAVLGDWDRPYATLEPQYEARELELLFRLLDDERLYRSFYPVYWSVSSATALAEAEVEYDPAHSSTAVWFRLRLVDEGRRIPLPATFQRPSRVFAVVYTTTPWTLPLNDAVCFGPGLDYELLSPAASSKLYRKSDLYVVASERVAEFTAAASWDFKSHGRISGDRLEGLEYIAPFWTDHLRPFFAAEHVKADVGSGLVHTAYAHGHLDFQVAREHGEEVNCYVDESGCYTREMGPELSSRSVLEDGGKWVLEHGRLAKDVLAASPLVHSYPIDWRTKKPLIIRASKQWFVDLGPLLSGALSSVEAVEVVEQGFSGGKETLRRTLESSPPWCISRQRVWGLPLPFFYEAETGRHVRSAALDAHLVALVRAHGSDIWWTAGEEQLFPLELRAEAGLAPGTRLEKSRDIVDVWFDSGLAWGTLEEGQTADLVVEGVDQYRGWFRASLLTAVAAGRPLPFKTIMSHGFAVDENSKKMSKSVGNVVLPSELSEGRPGSWKGLGVDGLRMWVAGYGCGHGVARIGAPIAHALRDNFRSLRLPLKFVLGATADLPSVSQLACSAMAWPHMVQEAVMSQSSAVCATDAFALGLVADLVEKVEDKWARLHFNHVLHSCLEACGFFSGLYFTIVKDRLYCEPLESSSRRSAQGVLRYFGDAVVGLLEPILPHLGAEFASHRGDQPSILKLRESLKDCRMSHETRSLFTEDVLPIRGEFLRLHGSQPLKSHLTLSVRDPGLCTRLQALNNDIIGRDTVDSELVDILGPSSLSLLLDEALDKAFVVDAVPCARSLCPRCRRHKIPSHSKANLCERCDSVLSDRAP